jgi:hypothetical protein
LRPQRGVRFAAEPRQQGQERFDDSRRTLVHLTTAMTLEVWVKPSPMVDWSADVIYKGDDTYYLEATSVFQRADR